jgi:hypothetical protein
MIDFHAEEINVEFSGASEILNVENYMVDAGYFEWGVHVSSPETQFCFLKAAQERLLSSVEMTSDVGHQ